MKPGGRRPAAEPGFRVTASDGHGNSRVARADSGVQVTAPSQISAPSPRGWPKREALLTRLRGRSREAAGIGTAAPSISNFRSFFKHHFGEQFRAHLHLQSLCGNDSRFGSHRRGEVSRLRRDISVRYCTISSRRRCDSATDRHK